MDHKGHRRKRLGKVLSPHSPRGMSIRITQDLHIKMHGHSFTGYEMQRHGFAGYSKQGYSFVPRNIHDV
jgi:hypothetical protein